MHNSFEGKDFVMDGMVFMIQNDNLEELDAIFDKMLSVLVAPFELEAIIARNELHELRVKGFEKLISEENENDTENEPKKFEGRKRKEDSINKESSFYSRFLEKLNILKIQLNPSENHVPKNNLHSLIVAQYIVDHYMPFATMWTEILISKDRPEISHFHNKHVEAHFHTVKDTVLDKNEILSIGRVIRRLKGYSTNLTKSIRFAVVKKKGSKPKTEFPQRGKVDISSATDLNVQEQWRKKSSQKREPRRRTHFEGCFLKHAKKSDVFSQNSSTKRKGVKKIAAEKKVNMISHVSSKRRRCSETLPDPTDKKFGVPSQVATALQNIKVPMQLV